MSELPLEAVNSNEHTLYENYGAFQDDIASLVAAYHGYGYGEIEHDAFLNTGAQSAAFLLEKDDKKYVVKLPRSSGDLSPARMADVEAHARVSGVPHYEQFVAASPEGVFIAEYVSGSDMADVTADQLRQVTSDQINQYVGTIIEGHAHGIGFDPKPGNVIYDPEDGFTIIDFNTIESSTEEYRANPALALRYGIEPLLCAGEGDGDRGERINDPAVLSELAKIKLPLMELYALSVYYQLDEKYHDSVLPNIAEAVAELRRYAFDMDGYQKEKAEWREQARRSAADYDPAKHGTIDDIF